MLKIGIKIEVKRLILFIPRHTTMIARNAKSKPNRILGMAKRLLTAFVCTKLPVLSEFIAHKIAKIEPKIKALFSPMRFLKPSYI